MNFILHQTVALEASGDDAIIVRPDRAALVEEAPRSGIIPSKKTNLFDEEYSYDHYR
jgi:hypothetical protein